jgi:hypothetical protein
MWPKLDLPEKQYRRLDPTGLNNPGQTCKLMHKGPDLDCEDTAGHVFGWLTIFAVWTQTTGGLPGHVANTMPIEYLFLPQGLYHKPCNAQIQRKKILYSVN